MKSVLTFLRRGLTGLGREAKRDDGVLALIIAIALIAAAAALLATTVRQNKEAEVTRTSGNSASIKLLNNSIIAYFLSDADGSGAGTAINGRVICPDASFPPDGTADGTTTCTANTGVVPWVTLGLPKEVVIDAYGNYFTYAVSGSNTSRQVCERFTSDLDTAQDQYPGTMNDVTDTEVRLSTQTAGQGTPYYYAFISHGKNGLGAISQSGARREAPTSSAEIQNCPATNTNCTDPNSLVLYSGPTSSTSPYFDDQVTIGSAEQLTQLCESLSPGGAANADISNPFTNEAIGAVPNGLTDASTGVSVQNSARTGNGSNKVLRFDGTVNGAIVRTNVATYNTAERPKYVNFQWAPTSGTTAGMSVVTRATVGDRQSGTTIGSYTADLFSPDGLTFRFYEDTASNVGSSSNRIYICDQTSVAGGDCRDTGTYLARSGTFTITLDTAYSIEVYDDGTLVWARITQDDNTSNTAVVTLGSVASPQSQDLTGFNAIGFINYSTGVTELDNLLVSRGSMAASFDGSGIVETASPPSASPDLTLEAWVRPTAFPASGQQATLISKWQDGGTVDSAQAYRLYMGSDGGLTLQLAGGTGGTVNAPVRLGGYALRLGRWDHIAVVYSSASSEQTVKLYVNRALISRSGASTLGTIGVNAGTNQFSIGAERNTSNAIANGFTGSITDVRVWSSARTAQEIFASYNRRIQLAGTLSGLALNWTLDRDTNTTFASPSAAPTGASSASSATGTFQTGASIIGIYQRHIPAFSTAFCGSGVKLTPYQCEFRNSGQSRALAVPNNLASVFVKAWGGGGGGYDFSGAQASGGGGGFSAGRLSTINSVAIAGASGLRVDIGGGAAAASSSNNGAGGGAASGFWRDADESGGVTTGDRPGIIAGGGGGASYGDDDFSSQVTGFNCDAAGKCGPGGGGGGPYNIAGLTGVSTTRAPDDSQGLCGGRGGDSASFGDYPFDPAPGAGGTSTCDDGGDDPTSTAGAGTGTNTGGTSALGNGGPGYNAGTNRVGGAGGGGGVSNTTMTLGGGEAGGSDGGGGTNNGTDGDRAGFGGGGGSGFAESTALNISGAAGTATATTSTAGGTTDAEYCAPVGSFGIGSDGATRPAYLATGCTTTFPARGGQPSDTTGHDGAVVIKW